MKPCGRRQQLGVRFILYLTPRTDFVAGSNSDTTHARQANARRHRPLRACAPCARTRRQAHNARTLSKRSQDFDGSGRQQVGVEAQALNNAGDDLLLLVEPSSQVHDRRFQRRHSCDSKRARATTTQPPTKPRTRRREHTRECRRSYHPSLLRKAPVRAVECGTSLPYTHPCYPHPGTG